MLNNNHNFFYLKNRAYIFLILIFLLFISCETKDKLPKNLKIGLVEFYVKESLISQQLKVGKNLDLGSLWINFNQINFKLRTDTLIFDVNVELNTLLIYDGEFEIIQDTLFLYAKSLEKTDEIKTTHSTVTYKILSNGLNFREVKFKFKY